MKHYKILTALSLLFSLLLFETSCSSKKEKEIKTNERGVPLTIADCIMGDNYEIDTLDKSDINPVILIKNPDYVQNIIYQGEQVLANDPTLEIDSIAPSVYQINDMFRSARVNFSSPQSIKAFTSVFPNYPEFSLVTVGDSSSVGQKAIFSYAVSVPDEKFKNSTDIQHWIESSIDDTIATLPNPRALGRKMEKDFFAEWSKEESEFTYTSSRSMLVYEVTPNYVTYHDYSWIFLGGAHGMYGNRLISYMINDNCPMTYDFLFMPDNEEEIRELIYEGLASDEEFMASHKITSLSQAKSYFQRYLMGDPLPIPQPAVLPIGIVFCYQPYEIACYADGAFQVVVPISKLIQYMNPKALESLNITLAK